MAEKEQVRPLAPASHRPISTDEEKAFPVGLKKHPHRRWINCCGCITALILILAVIILVLVFTVFHIKDPVMNLNSVKIGSWSWTNLQPGMNLTVTADVSVKNPNAASFKYNNATTSLYYDGNIIGESRTPPGHARARRTVRLNVTIDVMLEKIKGVPRLGNDLLSGILPVTSYTRISGRVNIFNIMKRGIVVEMNCTMTMSIASQEIKDQNCKHKFSL